MLHVRTVTDGAKPLGPGTYRDTLPFSPCLPKAPEVPDDDYNDDDDDNGGVDNDEFGLLKSSAKSHSRSQRGRRSHHHESAENKPDLASFRKLSLFDDLLDEVSTLGSGGALRSPESSGNSDGSSWPGVNTQHTRDTNSLLLDRMKEDELLPGSGRSGLTRNESIDVDQLKNPTFGTTVRPGVQRKTAAAEAGGGSNGTQTVPGSVAAVPMMVRPGVEVKAAEVGGGSSGTQTVPDSEPAVPMKVRPGVQVKTAAEAGGGSSGTQNVPGSVAAVPITVRPGVEVKAAEAGGGANGTQNVPGSVAAVPITVRPGVEVLFN